LCGPFRTNLMSGSRYLHTLIDHGTSYVGIWAIATKNSGIIFENLIRFIKETETLSGYKFKRVLLDGGGEFVLLEFNKFLDENGIIKKWTLPNSPQTNRICERYNLAFMNIIPTVLHYSQLPFRLSAEISKALVYIHNRTNVYKMITPLYYLTVRKSTISHLRSFGCKAYAYVDT
jgi:hypothetical protein